MKVADVMQRHVTFVSTDSTILDVVRIIFGRGINGVPVVEGKKLVGMITEQDILDKFHPSIQEYVDDYTHARDFESMEDRVAEILSWPASRVMNKNVTTVKTETPLLKAETMMKVKDVGRLPVVDGRGNLIGILSKGDIFRNVVGKKMPYVESEEYHDWIAQSYDVGIGWEQRLEPEIASLTKLFKDHKVKQLVDIGSGTGEHAIALAKKGYSVVGLENSRLMYKVAQDKWKKLPKALQKRVRFVPGDFATSLRDLESQYDAAIFMGNMLAHIPNTISPIMRELDRVLITRNAVIVAQLINYEKALKRQNRMTMFRVNPSKALPRWEHAFLWFYDPPRKGILALNAAMFDFDGMTWRVRSVNTVQTIPFTLPKLKSLVGKIGFTSVSFYGTEDWGYMFRDRFKPIEHDWLNVVAIR